MSERRREDLADEGLDQAFEEGLKWLNSLSVRMGIRESDVVVVIGGGTYVEGMGLGPKKVKGVRLFSVNLRFSNGTTENYSISSETGLLSVERRGDLQMDTMILGKLPIRGIRKLSGCPNSWGWETIEEGRYELVYNEPRADFSNEGVLQSDEVKERKIRALEVISWLGRNFT